LKDLIRCMKSILDDRVLQGSVIGVSDLPKNVEIEIEATAVLG